MNQYKHLFFDLDHTLWDFERNSQETLLELHDSFELNKFGDFSKKEFLAVFKTINGNLWKLYDQGLVGREKLRNERFTMVFDALGISDKSMSEEFSDIYLSSCPKKSNVFPFAIEVLDYLKEVYSLHIITNGFEDIQDTKLKSAGLNNYFDQVITSESTRFKKPQKEIFEYAMQMTGASKQDCVMIGDNLETDIKGAKAADIDHILFNPEAFEHNESVTHEINCLSELKSLL
ncbi:YjjG family noncanonical pyrimidine nucleotidase [Fulvivirgaceae bacterium BMA10]|uniref:YjjG family noncanonical pyrimidine nucleotidase n=1 Tax=Splendidivirga corallicola TaxID=3051826 RepID=A0ABT8KRA3_9BACT|nr:YjjG family noncanonical pyrimidine nucleotidase [Fulvivirgaceae bacterium BMA10]